MPIVMVLLHLYGRLVNRPPTQFPRLAYGDTPREHRNGPIAGGNPWQSRATSW